MSTHLPVRIASRSTARTGSSPADRRICTVSSSEPLAPASLATARSNGPMSSSSTRAATARPAATRAVRSAGSMRIGLPRRSLRSTRIRSSVTTMSNTRKLW